VTTLTHQLSPVQAGVRATVAPYGGNKYADDSDHPRAVVAISNAQGQLSWELPVVVPGRQGSWYSVTGIEARPVIIRVKTTAPSSVTVAATRTGTVDTEGEVVKPTGTSSNAAVLLGRVLNSDGTPNTGKRLSVKLAANGTDIDDLVIETIA
jgi:hypothetical protein